MRGGRPAHSLTVSTEQVLLPNGYRVAIGFENQPPGLCLHISMSSPKKGKVPRPEAVGMVLEAMGVEGQPARAWLEEFEPGRYAPNLVFLVEPKT